MVKFQRGSHWWVLVDNVVRGRDEGKDVQQDVPVVVARGVPVVEFVRKIVSYKLCR